MKINLIEINGVTFAEIINEKHEIKTGQALTDFIRESNDKGYINFVATMEEAQQVL